MGGECWSVGESYDGFVISDGVANIQVGEYSDEVGV
jgi:hypothetical protein